MFLQESYEYYKCFFRKYVGIIWNFLWMLYKKR